MEHGSHHYVIAQQASTPTSPSQLSRVPSPHRCAYTYNHFNPLLSAKATKMSLSSLLAPISLPLASLFAIPMLSSWSTSVNLVFFSLTWTTLAMSYSPLQLELFGPLFLRTMLYLLPSALFLLIDTAVPSLMVELKAQRDMGLAARQKGGTAKLRRVVGWSIFNVLLAVGLQAGTEWLVTDVFKMRSLLLIKGSRWSFNHLPNPWSLFKHAVIGVLSRNVSQPSSPSSQSP